MKLSKSVKMNLLRGMFFLLLMGVAVSVHALSQEVRVDLLMTKITTLLKANRPAEALPYFGELELMEPSLPKPLPESFYFYYIEALEKSGDRTKALTRAESYLERYGKKGRNYDKVIETMSRLQMQAEKEAKEKVAKMAAEKEAAIAKYNQNIKSCLPKHAVEMRRLKQEVIDVFNRGWEYCRDRQINYWHVDKKDVSGSCGSRSYDQNRYPHNYDGVSDAESALGSFEKDPESWCAGQFTLP